MTAAFVWLGWISWKIGTYPARAGTSKLYSVLVLGMEKLGGLLGPC